MSSFNAVYVFKDISQVDSEFEQPFGVAAVSQESVEAC